MSDQLLPNAPFKQTGVWRFPQVDELNAFHFRGELTWEPFEGATLELFVADEQSNLVNQLFGSSVMVQGELANIPLITIDHALVQGLQATLKGYSRVTISSYSMVKGQAWVDDIAATEIMHATAEMTGLREWAGGTNIVVTCDDDNSTCIRCRPAKSRSFANLDGLEVTIDSSVPQSHELGKFEAHDNVSFGISAPAPFTYQRARELVWELNRFLSLALDHPVVTMLVRVRLPDNSEGQPVLKFLEFYQRIDQKEWEAAAKTQRDHRIVLPFQDPQRISTAYLNFSRLYRAHRRALDFYFSGGDRGDSYIHQKFADMVHGLEGIDRGLTGGCYMDPVDYENVVKVLCAAVPRGVPDSMRSALKARLIYGNGFSLRKRLRILADRHPYLAGILGRPAHFGDDVADMRNDIAHAKGNEAPTLEGATRYFGMLHRVKILFLMELLLHLGLDEDFRKNALNRLGSVEIAVRPLVRLPRPEPEVPETRAPEQFFEIRIDVDGNIELPQNLSDAIGAKAGAMLRAQITGEDSILLF